MKRYFRGFYIGNSKTVLNIRYCEKCQMCKWIHVHHVKHSKVSHDNMIQNHDAVCFKK